MNDTNLMVLLMKILADQKAVAPVASGQTLQIWGMVISAVSPIIVAIVLWIGRQSIVTLKEHINSRMDELQEQTKKASFAEGQTQERASAAALVPPLPVVLTTPADGTELMNMMKAMSEEIAALKSGKT